MGGQPLVQFLNEIRNNQHDLMGCFEQLSKQVSNQQSLVERVLSGFPAADVEGHRRYHESVIEWRELRNKMVREAMIKASQAGTLAALGWLGLAIWRALKISVTQ